MDQAQLGIPSLDLLESVKWRGGEQGGHLGVSPVSPLTGRDARRQNELLRPIVERAGYGEYRAHLEVMDLVAEQYDFNDHAQRRFNERLKDALDPDGILSPGKQGIWPASLRPERN
jgi:4-cresol dehydrogenase (hydroxylating) flavoprotein subunit